MAEQGAGNITAEFPPQGFPNVFADGVISLANSNTIVKFYLGRFEPDIGGGGETRMQAFAQVVMPIESFVHTYAFFENRVQTFLKQGLITQDQIDRARQVEVGK